MIGLTRGTCAPGLRRSCALRRPPTPTSPNIFVTVTYCFAPRAPIPDWLSSRYGDHAPYQVPTRRSTRWQPSASSSSANGHVAARAGRGRPRDSGQPLHSRLTVSCWTATRAQRQNGTFYRSTFAFCHTPRVYCRRPVHGACALRVASNGPKVCMRCIS